MTLEAHVINGHSEAFSGKKRKKQHRDHVHGYRIPNRRFTVAWEGVQAYRLRLCTVHAPLCTSLAARLENNAGKSLSSILERATASAKLLLELQ
jgi:hypothetical protein